MTRTSFDYDVQLLVGLLLPATVGCLQSLDLDSFICS